MIDCDQVFDVLTQGSAPRNVQVDSAVREHMRTCSDCRSMAESIRPAINLLQETLASDQAPTGYVQVAVNQRINKRSVLTSYSIGLLLLIGIFSTMQTWLNASGDPAGVQNSGVYRQLGSVSLNTNWQLLASLHLPQGCIARPQDSDESLNCCTECHSVAGNVQLNQSFAVFMRSCSACHSLN